MHVQTHAATLAEIHVETAVTAGGGLSSSYSAVVVAAVTAVPCLAVADAATDVAAMTITVAAQSSGFCFYHAFVVMAMAVYSNLTTHCFFI